MTLRRQSQTTLQTIYICVLEVVWYIVSQSRGSATSRRVCVVVWYIATHARLHLGGFRRGEKVCVLYINCTTRGKFTRRKTP